MLSLLVGEGREHTFIELLNLGRRVFATLVCRGTLRTDLAHTHVLHLLLGRR